MEQARKPEQQLTGSITTKMYKYSAYIKPSRVSTRWKEDQDQPSDVQWSAQRSKQRINTQARNAAQQAIAKGSGIGKYFKGVGEYLQHKLRGAAKQDVMGTQYDTSKYSAPEKKGDVIIAFSGARNQPGGNMDTVMAQRYGKSNYVIFRPSQVDLAVQFAKKLPKGSKIYVQGMSHGGAAAAEFATRGIPIQRLITYDPVSHFGRLREKPKNVKKWYNVIAGDYDGAAKTNPIPDALKWIAAPLSDAAIDHGGRWGQVQGAINIHAPRASHSDVREMYRVLNRKFLQDRVAKQKLARLIHKAKNV